MFKTRIIINTFQDGIKVPVELSPRYGGYDKFKRNEELNEASHIIKNVTPAISDLFEDGFNVDIIHEDNIAINSIDIIVGNTYTIKYPGTTNWINTGADNNEINTVFIATAATSGTGTCVLAERIRWRTTNSPSNEINLALEQDEIIANFAEYTIKLQQDLFIGQSFKQPNDIQDDDPTTWRYTQIDIVEKLLFDSKLYTYAVKFGDYDNLRNATPITTNDFPQSLIDNSYYTYTPSTTGAEAYYKAIKTITVTSEDEFLANTASLIFDKDNILIDDDLYDLMSGRSADFEWRDFTVYQCLADVFTQIDAQVVLSYDYILDRDVLTYELYNERGNVANKQIDLTRINKVNNAQDNVTQSVTRYENISDTGVNNITFFPSKSDFMSIKSDSFYLSKDNNAKISTGGKPISKLIKVLWNLQDFADWLTIEGETVTLTGGSSSKNFVTDIVNNLQDKTIDISRQIAETVDFNTLPTSAGKITEGRNKANVLTFNRFKPGIRGIGYKDRGLYKTNTDILFNVLFTALFDDPNVQLLMGGTRSNYTYSTPWYEMDILGNLTKHGLAFKFWEDIDAFDDASLPFQSFQVQFISSADIVVETEKAHDMSYIDTRSRIFKKFYNQEERNIDVEKASRKSIGLVERLGNPDINVIKTHNNLNSRHFTSDFDGNEVITEATYVYKPNIIEGYYQYNKNFNRFSSKVGIDSAVRTANISADAEVEVLNLLKAWLIVDSEEVEVINDTGGVFTIHNEFLDEFLNTDTTDNELTFPLQTIRTGIDWDGSIKYSNISTSDPQNIGGFLTDGKGSTTILAPADVRVLSRSLLINAKLETKVSAGVRINDDRDVLPIPYPYLGTDSRYQGEYERAYGQIGYGRGAALIAADRRFLPYLASSNSDIKNTAEYIDAANIRIEFDNIGVYKTNNANVIHQIQIENKSRDEGIIIQPEFYRSHKMTGGSEVAGTFEVATITKKITSGVYSKNQLDDLGLIDNENIQYSYEKNGITSDGSLIKYLQISNNGNPYVLYNNRNKEILIINNEPKQYVNNTSISRLYLKLRSDVKGVLEQSLYDVSYTGFSASRNLLEQDEYDVYFNDNTTSNSSLIDLYVAETTRGGPILKTSGLHSFEFNFSYTLFGDLGKDTTEEDFGEYHRYPTSTFTLVSNDNIQRISMNSGASFNIKESMKAINGGIQLQQDNNTYNVQTIVGLDLKSGTGTPTEDQDSGDLDVNKYQVTVGEDLIKYGIWTDEVTSSSNGAEKRMECFRSRYGLIPPNHEAVYTDIDNSIYVNSIIESDAKLTETIWENVGLKVLNASSISINLTAISLKERNCILRTKIRRPDGTLFETHDSDEFRTTGDIRNVSINTIVGADYEIKFYIRTTTTSYTKNAELDITDLTIKSVIPSNPLRRDLDVSLVRASSTWGGTDSNYTLIETKIVDSYLTTSLSFNNNVTIPSGHSHDTLYVIAQMGVNGSDSISGQKIIQIDMDVTSPFRIDKQVFAELTNLDGTYRYDDEYPLGDGPNSSGNVKKIYDVEIPAGRENDGLKLRIYGKNGVSLNPDDNADDRVTLSNLELDIRRRTQ